MVRDQGSLELIRVCWNCKALQINFTTLHYTELYHTHNTTHKETAPNKTAAQHTALHDTTPHQILCSTLHNALYMTYTTSQQLANIVWKRLLPVSYSVSVVVIQHSPNLPYTKEGVWYKQ